MVRNLTNLFCLALCLLPCALPSAELNETDICIYGGTASGVAAAVQAARMGQSVVLIEPTRRLGGLTTGGLGQTDIGNKQAIGGIAREFYQRVRRHYTNDAAWKWETRQQYQDGGQTRTAPNEGAMWTFEPSVALKILNDFVSEANVSVVYGERLDLKAGVTTRGNNPKRITEIRMESGRRFRAKMFIDATYEGDLLAKAGVSYTVGREANAQYNETLNGVQTAQGIYHQLQRGVDPYVRKGGSSSGLLPGIDPTGPGVEGAGDRRVQAYCFRMCLTDRAENRIPFAKPDGYRELDYELLFRNFEAGETSTPWIHSLMPNRKTDINNRLGFSTDFIGQNYDYPEANYAERVRIKERHKQYQQGLMWTLGNHPRVPEKIRAQVGPWGLCKDEFVETGGWQEQLYIREARRLVGETVMTQHHCEHREVAKDAVGLAAYGMDSHHVQRHLDANGHVRNEGDVQVRVAGPYPISYRALVPKSAECANLLVTVALSASHIAYGSIRMEPVFMVLGQSAATAAALAIKDNVPVQKLDYEKLRTRLAADKQVLEAKIQPRPLPTPLAQLEGIVVDDTQATKVGQWIASTVPEMRRVGTGYVHDGDARNGEAKIVFTPDLPAAGEYEIRVYFPPNPNRAARVPVTVTVSGGETRITHINQRSETTQGVVPLGRFKLPAGKLTSVTLSNRDTDGYVVADGVQFLPVK
jgi:ribulose 1,5-bisphosphate synthetase/thiazole synthase